MSDFEPVEIRLDLIQNVDSEGEKAEKGITEIAAASDKMRQQFEKDITAQKALTTQLINELKLLKETMAKKVETGDDKQIVDKQKLIEQTDLQNKKLIEQQDEVKQAALTWQQFTSQRMGPYMKELGGHSAAIKKIAEEYKVYKANIDASTVSLSKSGTADEKQAIDKQKLIGQIDLLNKKLIEQEALLERISKKQTTPSNLPKMSNDVDAYARQVKNLNFSMTQISRELPNFAISPMIGIMSLSNNLPMLQGDITRMIELNKQLKDSGQATIPVWKQIGSALFSWQTALIAGISALMLWGPQIGNFISNLFKAKGAIGLTKDELKGLNETFAKTAGADLGKLKTMFDDLKNAKKGTTEYFDAKKQIIDQFGGYLKGMDSEIASLNNVKGAYQALTTEILKAAKAKALQETNSKLATDFLTKSNEQYDIVQKKFIESFGKDLGKMRFNMFQSQLESGNGFSYEMQRYIDEFTKKEKTTSNKVIGMSSTGQVQYAKKIVDVNPIKDAINAYTKAKDELDAKTKDAFDRFGNKTQTPTNNTVQVIDDRIQALKTEQKQVSDNKTKWDEYQKQIDQLEKDKEAITGKKNSEKEKPTMIEVNKEYLDLQNQIIAKAKELDRAIAAGDTAKGLILSKQITQLQKQQNDLVNGGTPIKGRKASLTQTSTAQLELKPMKQLTEEERKQLEIRAKKAQQDLITADMDKDHKEKLKEQLKLSGEIAEYALQLVDSLASQMDLTEGQAAILNSAMNSISAIGRGDYVGAAISGFTAAITGYLDTTGIENKLSRPWEEFEKWIARSNDALERYIKLRDEAIGSERYTATDQAIAEAKKIKEEAEAKLSDMKLSWTFKDFNIFNWKAWDNVEAQIKAKEKELGDKLTKESAKDAWGTVKVVMSYDLNKVLYDDKGNFTTARLQELIDQGVVTDEAVVQALKDYNDNIDKLLAAEKEKQQLLTDTMANSITDSIVDGFKNGYKSASDFADNFEELMKDAVLNSVKIKALEEPLKKWYDQFSQDMESGGGLDESEKDRLKKWWDDIVTGGIAASNAALEAAGIDATYTDTRTGSTKGIAQASQDSIDETNGRLTAIQAYIYDIRNMNQQSFDFEKESAAYDAAILSQLQTIAENTEYCKLLEDINRVLGDINLKGIKIKS